MLVIVCNGPGKAIAKGLYQDFGRARWNL